MPLCITTPNKWKVGLVIEVEFEHQSLSDSSIGVWRFEVILETLPDKNLSNYKRIISSCFKESDPTNGQYNPVNNLWLALALTIHFLRAIKLSMCAPVSNQVLVWNLSLIFNLLLIWFTWKWTCRRNTFSYEWFYMMTRAGTEAKGNSEVAHWL